MQTRCYRCNWNFAIKNEEIAFVLESLEESGGMSVISVSDSGVGISPEIRDDLFKPFRTTKPDGTGLGLAISDALVRAHGGRIEVAGGAKGGALFRVAVPTTSRAGDET